MLKLHRWNKIISILIVSCFLGLSSVSGGNRFDFEIHKGHFLSGEYKTKSKELSDSIEFEIVFKDGCSVKYNMSKRFGRAEHWRWSKRNVHGKLMNKKLDFLEKCGII